MIKTIHLALAFVSVAGFILRAVLAYARADLLKRKWVRIAPHVIDTLLLVLGLVLAFTLVGGPMQSWLGAKLLALLAYIGFGVLTLRGHGIARHVGVLGALVSVSYIFSVAFTRQVWPF